MGLLCWKSLTLQIRDFYPTVPQVPTKYLVRGREGQGSTEAQNSSLFTSSFYHIILPLEIQEKE